MSSDLAAIFEHIDQQRDASVGRLVEYLRHPSISAYNEGIAEVAALLQRMLTGIGLDTTVIPTAGHPMVVARWDGAPGRPTVLLYGHYDVQTARSAGGLDHAAVRAARSGTAASTRAGWRTTRASIWRKSWRSKPICR